jgi:hypothetical protein
MTTPLTPQTPRRGTIIAFLAVVTATLLVGVIQGKLSRRWGLAPDLLAVVARLESFGANFGDWELSESSRLEPGVIEMLECAGHLRQTYVHRKTGQAVNVAVMLGPPGPIAVHTPEICFSSRAHQQDGERQKVQIHGRGGRADELWVVNFQPKNSTADHLRVYYGWTTDGAWQASPHPRFQFSGQPWLYKIQLATVLPAGVDASKTDAVRDFLLDFLPALNAVLGDAPSPS